MAQHSSKTGRDESENILPEPPLQQSRYPTEEAIRAWLISTLAVELEIDPGKIDVKEPFASLGLGSMQAASLAGSLEDWLGTSLPPTLAYEYPSIEAVARHLSRKTDTLESPDEVATQPGDGTEPIAIVGIGCRFPGATSPASFWRLIREGSDAISEAPERFNSAVCDAANPTAPGRIQTHWGGFLEQVDLFDADFFGISPREAAAMDPQQRLLLEVAWESIEDAGQLPEQIAGSRTGVFIGISSNDYGLLQFSTFGETNVHRVSGNALSVAANRLSYVLNSNGPSMAVDTACSSSLVALHLACQSLHCGESTQALVGGVNVLLWPAVTATFEAGGLMAPDGRCKAFDASANGYARGEGAGVVFIKPLSKALADNDTVYAIIRGTAVNHDGRSNGLTAPSQKAQERVLEQALERAKVEPRDVRYVEAHGTGTLVGDRIEAMALGAVLGRGRAAHRPCAVGSVKTNVGHLEAAAGMSQLIKVAMMLKHREIPRSLHFREPNPHIPFQTLPIYVQQRLSEWPEDSRPATAGVSAFGFGGTNAHAVLTEGPRNEIRQAFPDRADGRPRLLPLSAKSSDALEAMAREYRDFLSPEGLGATVSLSDLCYTAGARRTHRAHRLALVGRSHEEFTELISRALRGETGPGLARDRVEPGVPSTLVFVFCGQGAQWWAMGRELLRKEPVFSATLAECDALIQHYADWSLVEELSAEESHSRMAETEIAHPALFSLQKALVSLWQSWGIEADAVVGHGVGEVAAAQVAGAIGLDEAVRIAVYRGRLNPDALVEVLAEVKPRETTRLLCSTVDGGIGRGSDFSPVYWGRNATEPAHFEEAIAALLDEGYNTFVEVGPQPVLSTTISGILQSREQVGTVLPSLRRDNPDVSTMLESLAKLYAMGHRVLWNGVYGPTHRCVSLPSYPWQRERFWNPGDAARNSGARPQGPYRGVGGERRVQEPQGSTQENLELRPFRDRLMGHEPGERYVVLESHVHEQIARVLGFPPSRIERSAPLDSLGLDSLNALELKTRLEAELRVSLPATLSWGGDFTIASFATELAHRLDIAVDHADAHAPADSPGTDLPQTESDQIASMLEEIERHRARGPGSKL